MAHNQGDILLINGPNHYKKYFPTDPLLGHLWLDGRGSYFLKTILWPNRLQMQYHPLISGIQDNGRYELHAEPANIVNNNTANCTLLNRSGGIQ